MSKHSYALMRDRRIDYRRTHVNAYQVIDRTGLTTWRSLGRVAKIDGSWIAEVCGERSDPLESRKDAVEDCLIMAGVPFEWVRHE